MRKFVLYPVFFILFLSFASCGSKKDTADAYGVFEATEIIVSSENNGKLLYFNIEEGKTYQKGEEVGCIDTFQIFLQIKQLESSIKAALARRPDMPTQIQA